MLTEERRSQLGLVPPPLPVERDEGISLREIIAMLRRRMRLIVLVALLGTGLAILVAHQIEPRYRATAALMLDPVDGQMLEIAGAADAKPPIGPEVLQTQVALITSRSHLEPVMRDLGLFRPLPATPAGDGAPSGLLAALPDPIRQLAGYVPETWLVAAGLAKDALPEELAGGAETSDPEAAAQAAVDHFRRGLEVRRAADSFVITVSYTDHHPGFAAAVANAVADSYVGAQLERRRLAAGRAVDWLQQRLDTLREAVATSEQAAADFRAAHGLHGPGGNTFNEQRMLDVNRQLIDLRAQQLATEAKLRRAQQIRAQGQNLDALADSLGSALIANLRAQEVALRREEAELAQTYGARHPTMVNLRAQIDEVASKLRQEIDRGIRNIEDELAVLASRERALAEDLAEIDRQQDSNQETALRLRELERQAEAVRQHYEALLRRFKATQEQESLSLPDAEIISPAVPPEQPITPGPRVFALIGFTVSSMFGGLLALVLERLNRRVRSAAALERELGVPVLGLMPRLPSGKARRNVGGYMVERPLSEFAEAARSILMGVQLSAHGLRSPALLVTSALPEEGKSTLSVALALAAASSGFRALLIDLDLRRPTLGQRLAGRSGRGAGLVDHVEGRLPFEHLIQHEPQSGIDFVLAGRPATRPLTVLQSPELRHLIESARKSYDYVILDSAPLLAVAEARTAAWLADRVVLASRWRRTDIEAVSHAVRVLMQIQADLAGCVLTDVRMNRYKLYASDGGGYYGQYRSYYTN